MVEYIYTRREGSRKRREDARGPDEQAVKRRGGAARRALFLARERTRLYQVKYLDGTFSAMEKGLSPVPRDWRGGEFYCRGVRVVSDFSRNDYLPGIYIYI